MVLNNPRGPKRRVKADSYIGDENATRRILTGFKCLAVILFCVTAPTTSNQWILIEGPDTRSFGGVDVSLHIRIHATDGFIVQNGGGASLYGNVLASDYNYIAIGAD